MKNSQVVLIFFAIICGLYACTQDSQGIEYGQLNGSNYTNQQFNLSIGLPQNWYFMDKENNIKLAKENIEKIAGEQADSEEILEYALETSVLIFTLFKHRPDTLIDVNPNMTITATDVSKTPKLKDLGYAIEQVKINLKEMNGAFQFQDEVTETKINGKTFKGYNSQITIDGMTANYESFLGNYDNHNLLITISYKDDFQKTELKNILKGIKTLD